MTCRGEPGYKCKVTLGADTVLGMGVWSISGGASAQLDDTEFLDNSEKFCWGIATGEDITFSGLMRANNSAGQLELQKAKVNKTDLNTIKFWMNSVSGFVPNQTAGYFHPLSTTGNLTDADGYVNIISYDIGADKAGLVTIGFTAKVSGTMVLV